MTKQLFHEIDHKALQRTHIRIFELGDRVHSAEKDLIEALYEIDQTRTYIRLGYRSLLGFCIDALWFSRTQAQRIVTQVRRYEPT